jgi:hypothetical protein
MDRTLFDAIVMVVHIISAATFVGPQILLAAAMPGIRSLEDVRSRQQVTRPMTWFDPGRRGVVLFLTGVELDGVRLLPSRMVERHTRS